MRWGAYALVVLVLAAVSGLAPGDSRRATVDHCYVKGHDWAPRETECIGHWSVLGRTFTGLVYAADIGAWPVIPGPRTAPGWNEVAVPDNARDHEALVAPGGALVTPWLVWFMRAALVVVVVVPVVAAATRRRALRVR